MPLPLALTDSQLTQIMQLARPLSPHQRSTFLEMLAGKLNGQRELGDGEDREHERAVARAATEEVGGAPAHGSRRGEKDGNHLNVISSKIAFAGTAYQQNRVWWYDQVMRTGLPFHQELDLKPGTYILRFGVMDRDTRKVGTVDVQLTTGKTESAAAAQPAR